MRNIVTGVKAGGIVAVTKGLALGETVVTEGQDAVSEGSHVTVGDGPVTASATPGQGGA